MAADPPGPFDPQRVAQLLSGLPGGGACDAVELADEGGARPEVAGDGPDLLDRHPPVDQLRAQPCRPAQQVVLVHPVRVSQVHEVSGAVGNGYDPRLTVGRMLEARVVAIERKCAARRALDDLFVSQHPEQPGVLTVVGRCDGLVDHEHVERAVASGVPQNQGGHGQHGECQDDEEADDQSPSLAKPREHMQVHRRAGTEGERFANGGTRASERIGSFPGWPQPVNRPYCPRMRWGGMRMRSCARAWRCAPVRPCSSIANLPIVSLPSRLRAPPTPQAPRSSMSSTPTGACSGFASPTVPRRRSDACRPGMRLGSARRSTPRSRSSGSSETKTPASSPAWTPRASPRIFRSGHGRCGGSRRPSSRDACGGASSRGRHRRGPNGSTRNSAPVPPSGGSART